MQIIADSPSPKHAVSYITKVRLVTFSGKNLGRSKSGPLQVGSAVIWCSPRSQLPGLVLRSASIGKP